MQPNQNPQRDTERGDQATRRGGQGQGGQQQRQGGSSGQKEQRQGGQGQSGQGTHSGQQGDTGFSGSEGISGGEGRDLQEADRDDEGLETGDSRGQDSQRLRRGRNE
jgi:hypothetical protein